MKTSIKLLGAIAASATLLAACSKSESEPAAGDVQKPAEKAATGMSEPAKPAAPATAADVQAMAQTAMVQTMTDKAKSLITEKKYPEALASLEELSKLKLTPEQEKLVTGLKEQIQKAMAGSAAAVPTNAAGAIPKM